MSETRSVGSEALLPESAVAEIGFKEDNGVEYAGTHIIIDMWGIDAGIPNAYLNDMPYIEAAIKEAAVKAGATILHTYLHPFDNGGVSGVLVLAESHISVHTWPERDYAAFDVFMCGKADPDKAVEVLKEWFEPKRIVVGKMKRGVS